MPADTGGGLDVTESYVVVRGKAEWRSARGACKLGWMG